MRLRLVGPIAGATLALAVFAGCGSGGGSTGVASLGGASAPDQDTKTANVDPEKAFQKFAACMREHGVDMPDPEVSGEGGDGPVVFAAPVNGDSTIESGPGLDDPTFQAAQEACGKFLENVVNGRRGKVDEAEMEKMKQQALKFARCMRAEGIDFPDPQFGTGPGGGGMTMIAGPDGGIDPNDPTFAAAQEKCAKQSGMPSPGERGTSGVRTGGGSDR